MDGTPLNHRLKRDWSVSRTLAHSLKSAVIPARVD